MQRIPHIVIVEDDFIIRKMYSTYLSHNNCRITEIENCSQFLNFSPKEYIDLVILDLLLPDGDGLDLFEKIKSYSEAKVVIVSIRSSEEVRIQGLELGADAYLTKNVTPKRLYAQIKRFLQPVRYDCLYFTLNRIQREAIKDNDEIIKLTESEFLLLNLFTEHPNEVLERDFLEARVTRLKMPVGGRIIDNLVKKLRKYLNPGRYNLFQSVRGVGYRFVPK